MATMRDGRPVDAGRLRSARIRGAVASASGERTRASMLVDALLVVGCAATAAWSVSGQRSVWLMLPEWWMPVDVAVGVLASILLWWRRRHPVAVAVALAVVGGVFISAAAPAIIAVYTVASLRRASIAVAVTLLHLGIAVPYYLVVPIGDLGLTTWVVFMVLIYVTALTAGLAVRARRHVIVALVASAEAERRDQELRTAHARDAERARIAREMHDVLAHRLSILSVHAGALEHRARDGSAHPLRTDEVRETAAVIRSSAHTALEELHEVLAVLGSNRPDGELGAAAPQPTAGDLDRLVAEAGTVGQRVRLDVTQAERLTASRPQLQRTVYRVVQEGLTNARKHAAGAAVDVHVVASSPDQVAVTVSNPVPVGVTSTEIPGARSGLSGLTERVELDGGSLRTRIHDGLFTLEVILPWRV